MASLTLKRGVWYAIFTENYKQKWVKIGKMSKTAAKEVFSKLEQSHGKKKFGIVDERHIPLENFTTKYLEYSKANKALGTYERDKSSIRNILRFLKGIYLPRLTPHQIEQFKIKRLDEGVSPRTVNIETRCLSNMLNKAVEWQFLRESPYKGIKLFRYEKKPPRFLTKEEVRKLMETASPWLKPILTVMLNIGIREGERRSLRFEDMDFKNKRIIVRAPKTKDFRSIPMNKEVEETLKWLEKNYIPPFSDIPNIRQEHQKEYVFCHEDGSPVLRIKRAFNNACKKAGLENVTPHTLRHTFASHLVIAGIDLSTVQRLLGHRDIATTMIYAHLTEDHLARGVEKLKW